MWNDDTCGFNISLLLSVTYVATSFLVRKQQLCQAVFEVAATFMEFQSLPQDGARFGTWSSSSGVYKDVRLAHLFFK